MSQHKGQKNPAWKGNEIKVDSLHKWVKEHLDKPDKCSFCNQKKELTLANMTGIYNRELENWKYLCLYCHRRYDAGWLFYDNKWFKACANCKRIKEVSKENFPSSLDGNGERRFRTWCHQCKKALEYHRRHNIIKPFKPYEPSKS